MLNRLKISLILAPLALMMLIGVYVYSLWSEERKRAAEIPFDATGALNRDLRRFHEKRGSFPIKLEDLESVIWEKKERNYVADGRSLIHRNYFYIYSRVNHHQFTLWAVPIGREREEASTFFFVGKPGLNRTWKGPPVPPAEIENLMSPPSRSQMGILGLVEQGIATR